MGTASIPTERSLTRTYLTKDRSTTPFRRHLDSVLPVTSKPTTHSHPLRHAIASKSRISSDTICGTSTTSTISPLPLPLLANMLSYNTSVAVNGQRPSSSGAMSSGRQSIPPSPTAARLATALSNGVTSNGAMSTAESSAKTQHIWLVTGPAGCGKSTVAKHIADSLHLPFIEGDEVCHHLRA